MSPRATVYRNPVSLRTDVACFPSQDQHARRTMVSANVQGRETHWGAFSIRRLLNLSEDNSQANTTTWESRNGPRVAKDKKHGGKVQNNAMAEDEGDLGQRRGATCELTPRDCKSEGDLGQRRGATCELTPRETVSADCKSLCKIRDSGHRDLTSGQSR